VSRSTPDLSTLIIHFDLACSSGARYPPATFSAISYKKSSAVLAESFLFGESKGYYDLFYKSSVLKIPDKL